MFGTTCDTPRCAGAPVMRVRRHFVPGVDAVDPATGLATWRPRRHRDGRPVEVRSDREVCPDCLAHFNDVLVPEPGTISAERSPIARPEVPR